MADILFIRNKCDTATTYTHWIGNGLKPYLESKGFSVVELSDAQATPENVHYWLNYASKRTLKAVIGFDHGSCDAFYGEKNNNCTKVISKVNVENLTKELHVYTYACSTNGNNCVGEVAVQKGCYSWLGYTVPVYVLAYHQSLKKCIWSYVEAMAAGKTIEQCEAALRKAYKDRISEHWVFKYNLDRLLLRKRYNNMTINSHNRGKWQNNKKIIGLWIYGPQKRNTWVYVQGLGWRKLWPVHDSQVEAMMTMAANAKAKNRNVNFYEEGNKIKQMFVW